MTRREELALRAPRDRTARRRSPRHRRNHARLWRRGSDLFEPLCPYLRRAIEHRAHKLRGPQTRTIELRSPQIRAEQPGKPEVSAPQICAPSRRTCPPNRQRVSRRLPSMRARVTDRPGIRESRRLR